MNAAWISYFVIMFQYYCILFCLYGFITLMQHPYGKIHKSSPNDCNLSDNRNFSHCFKCPATCPLSEPREQPEVCLPHFLVADNETQGVLRLYIARRGRLGNAMFEFASAYSIAKATGRLLVLDPHFIHDLLELFPNVRNKFLIQHWSEQSREVYTISDFHFGRFTSWYLTHLPTIDLNLEGHYQTWKYFTEFESDIRHFFEIDSRYADRAKSTVDNARGDAVEKYLNIYCRQFGHCDLNKDNGTLNSRNDGVNEAPIRIGNITVIGVHVRRGDLLTDDWQKENGRTLAPLSYIFKAMEFYRERFPHPFFIIASDDIEWCTEHFRFPDVRFLVGQSAFEDFSVLASCDHMLVSVGSFGWWAGWLTKGLVVYYADMIRPHSAFWGEFYQPEDSFPPSWIPMR